MVSTFFSLSFNTFSWTSCSFFNSTTVLYDILRYFFIVMQQFQSVKKKYFNCIIYADHNRDDCYIHIFFKFLTCFSLFSDELKNLQSYCVRMKKRFWPDWDECCRKGSKYRDDSYIQYIDGKKVYK